MVITHGSRSDPNQPTVLGRESRREIPELNDDEYFYQIITDTDNANMIIALSYYFGFTHLPVIIL